MNGLQSNFILDTGAEALILSYATWKKLGRPCGVNNEKETSQIETMNGQTTVESVIPFFVCRSA